MKKLKPSEIEKILADHRLWLAGKGGKRANFRDTDLKDAVFRGAELEAADFRGADCQGVSFWGAGLRNANLRGANFRGADLDDAVLRGADLRCTDLQGATLKRANMRGAVLMGADLQGVTLQWADLRGANLRGVGLVVLLCGQYMVYANSATTQIGCANKENEFWKSATEEDVKPLASDAVEWWQEWRAPLLMLIAKVEQLEAKRKANN